MLAMLYAKINKLYWGKIELIHLTNSYLPLNICQPCCMSKSTRIDVYETFCPQQMLVHKGGKIKNWGGECRDVTPTKL